MWGSWYGRMGFMSGRKQIGKSLFTRCGLTTCSCGKVCKANGWHGQSIMSNPPESEEYTGTVCSRKRR